MVLKMIAPDSIVGKMLVTITMLATSEYPQKGKFGRVQFSKKNQRTKNETRKREKKLCLPSLSCLRFFFKLNIHNF